MLSLGSLLAGNEVLLVALVVLAGLLLGRVPVFGIRLGSAGVLFVGLGLSAWLQPYAPLHVASSIKELGLVLFVYAGLLSCVS
jgi:putative transport protein